MKKSILKIWILLAMILSVYSAGAQVSTYERTPGYYTFGLNGGFAYQEGDIPTTLDGYGLGFTLGKNLYYQPGSLLSFDIRGRALYSQTKGQDYFRSYGIGNNNALNGALNLDYTKKGGQEGFVFQNNKTDQVELGVEGVVNFNSLRENTNVVLSVYGGVGLNWYNVKTDQADRNGLYTDGYMGVDTLGSVSYIKQQLKTAILDGEYETLAHDFDGGMGKIGIMPSVGVELGYQFTPKFSMGVGHKVTYAKTDLLDGHQWNNNGNLSADDDIHHYTNLHMRWIIDNNNKKLQAPVVDITNPGISPHSTRKSTFDLRATVKHVKSAVDVQLMVNGYQQNFDFRKRDLKSRIRLEPGNNEVVVVATNNTGTARDVVNIFYQDPIIDTDYDYPTVSITNPPYEGYRTDEQRFNIKADVQNVNSKRDVELMINGREVYDFNYRRGYLTANVDLKEGRNTIRVTAKNSDGFDSDESSIIYERAFQAPPRVEITKPSENPYETAKSKVSVEARVYNVENKNDIRYTINGYESYDFDFSNGIFRANVLRDDFKSVIVISGTNETGDDSDSVTIFWDEEEDEFGWGDDDPVFEPVVTITSTSEPTVDPFNPDNCRSTIIATILNVQDRDDVDVWVNGIHFIDYEFNTTTQILKATVQLDRDANEVKIRATNAAGSDQDIVTIEGCVAQEDLIDPPVVTIEQPRNNSMVDHAKINLIAKAKNVSNRSNIEVYLNGKRITKFSFDKRDQEITAELTLEKGNNLIRVVGSNEAGTDEVRANVKFFIPRPDKPQVSIVKPINGATMATSKASLFADVTNVIDKEEIQLTVNGITITDFTFSKNQVKATVNLRANKNTIIVKASTRGGSDQDQVTVYFELPQPDLPEVEITNPAKDFTSRKGDVTIEAKIENIVNRSGIIFTHNGRRVNAFSYRNGAFKAQAKLDRDLNTFVIKVRNADGEDQDQVIVDYPIAKPILPVINITNPARDITTQKGDVTIEANIMHVVSKNNITFRHNGRQVNGFSYQRGTFRASVKLYEGKNTFVIRGTNAGGEGQDQVTVTYNVPEITPTVRITAPKSNQSFENTGIRLSADISHVKNKRGVTVTLNGKGVNFNYANGKLNATLTLQKGRNTISVKGTNSAGSDIDEVIVIYKPKPNVPKPEVYFTAPRKADGFTKDAKYIVKATVKNVKSKDKITFKLNGRSMSKFNYNNRTGEVSVLVNLTQGKNELFIEASNVSGKASDRTSISYKPTISRKNPAEVDIISVSQPTVDPFDPNKAKSTIIAKLKHVTSKRQIIFKLNGKKISSYDFNTKTGDLKVTINLKKGENTFEITASNNDGGDKASKTVDFKVDNTTDTDKPSNDKSRKGSSDKSSTDSKSKTDTKKNTGKKTSRRG